MPTKVPAQCQLPTHGDVTPVGLPSKIRSTAHLPFHSSWDASTTGTLVLRWRCFFRHLSERPQVSSLIPVAAPHCRFRALPLAFLAALLRISSATYIPTSIALLSRTVSPNCPHHGLPGLREAVPGGADRDETATCEARIWPEGEEALQSVLVVASDYFLRHFPDRCALPVSRKHSMRTVT